MGAGSIIISILYLKSRRDFYLMEDYYEDVIEESLQREYEVRVLIKAMELERNRREVE